MRKIPLTQGYFALVDDEDYAYLRRFSWYAIVKSNTVYAYNDHSRMHRVIMKPPGRMKVHHKNGDGLDNRKCNLVVTTQQENVRQAKKRADATSQYKGVSWRIELQRWHARLYVDGKVHLLGNFDEESAAAAAYNTAVLKHLGEGYPLNLVGGQD